MKIDYYDIKSDKQDNGIWGSPMNLISMEGLPFDIDIKLHTAIVMAMSELYDSTFKITSQSIDSFLIIFNKPVMKHIYLKNHFVVNYKNYVLIDNRIYFVKNDKEKRYLKLKILNESV